MIIEIKESLLANPEVTSTGKLMYGIIEKESPCTRSINDFAVSLGLTQLAASNALKKLDSLGLIETLKVKTDKNVLKYNYKVKGL